MRICSSVGQPASSVANLAWLTAPSPSHAFPFRLDQSTGLASVQIPTPQARPSPAHTPGAPSTRQPDTQTAHELSHSPPFRAIRTDSIPSSPSRHLHPPLSQAPLVSSRWPEMGVPDEPDSQLCGNTCGANDITGLLGNPYFALLTASCPAVCLYSVLPVATSLNLSPSNWEDGNYGDLGVFRPATPPPPSLQLGQLMIHRLV
ncbi:unnamed protein product [Protopolystoma xenopodis]|uniref:Uncharacterized protein n=1 Tax=Protopolystoma xenopodis TaxID=117903 RepID=A0A3S5AV35_9PLAT|nr:unnamed protein product [Protopolystoma xenopodis]